MFLTATLALLAISTSCTPAEPADNQATLGRSIFAANCADCHGAEGTGGPGPRLAGNTSLQSATATIDQVLNGGGFMPEYGSRLSDTEIAAVVSHIRSSWGNSFGTVTAAQVAQQRSSTGQARY
jgi:mono/diheme cytochrome c family protein